MDEKMLYTTTLLFETVNNILREENLLPEILDYSLAASRVLPIKTIEWDCIGIVNFGGCEGIYLDIYLEGDTGNDTDRILLGTYKTLYQDKESFRAMSDLNTEFVFALREFVSNHADDFNWTGYDVQLYKKNKKTCSYWSTSDLNAERLIQREFKRGNYDYAVIVENTTCKSKKILNENKKGISFSAAYAKFD